MLAKILQDMWVEPEVLEALSEEQKRILFLKMREEQVRRWREREEREGQDSTYSRPKKGCTKRVSWLLSRDGDVSVSVIGEMDEFRSSRLLQGLFNNRRHSDEVNSIQTADTLPGLTPHIQLPLTDVHDSLGANEWSEEEMDGEAAEDSDSDSGSSSDHLSNWAPLYRTHLSHHGNQPPVKAMLSAAERVDQQNGAVVVCEEKNSAYGGRVAELRKAFTSDHSTPPACTKPPPPAKPLHLQKRSKPMLC
ncbi:uncharacterized protein zgc:92242 [Thalassophryne amazonica]|uniref:uncharacterized protein zgc:92242 n=1 Tax=Thalassophryne amazonica TaxID=390379 RepID=UPI0014720FA9|nr:uncharacterized protein zgc:92242 [Thalassophryne amazonica]